MDEALNLIADNGDRRAEIERRAYLYTLHIPERRSGKERRYMARRKTSRIFTGFTAIRAKNANQQHHDIAA